MKLGVIGSGNIGKAIGSWAAKLGYEVTFSAANEQHAKEAAAAAGHGARSGSVREAATHGDLVLLAVPYDAVREILADIGPLLSGKTLIDVTNALTEDMSALQIGHTTSAAEEIARLAPGAKVVKAFNTVFAQIYASQSPVVQGRTLSVFVAGDDAGSKARVLELARKMGFDPIDTGPLRVARFIEPLAMLNIHLGYGLGMGTDQGFSLSHAKAREGRQAA
jgi:8-hydroxy-5-deazaflavin:NADPH oxidoreductase